MSTKSNTSPSSSFASAIWEEQPSTTNPYHAEQCRCHGYDLLELIKKRSFIDVLFLLFTGELPGKDQAQILEALMIALINPGPRHPATRSAVNAGLGRTNTAHILPIALSVLSGNHLGGAEVTASMRFFSKHLTTKIPESIASDLFKKSTPPEAGDWHIAPGFGNRFGGIDPIPQQIAGWLTQLPGSGKTLQWGNRFAASIKQENMGWLSTGIAAAVFCDLDIPAKAGSGLFQFISAPGLLAHGLEASSMPISTFPSLFDKEQYVFTK